MAARVSHWAGAWGGFLGTGDVRVIVAGLDERSRQGNAGTTGGSGRFPVK